MEYAEWDATMGSITVLNSTAENKTTESITTRNNSTDGSLPPSDFKKVFKFFNPMSSPNLGTEGNYRECFGIEYNYRECKDDKNQGKRLVG